MSRGKDGSLSGASTLIDLLCTACGNRVAADRPQTVCPVCGKVLFATYDIERARQTLTPDSMVSRPRGIWRFAELMPLQDPKQAVELGEGSTPLSPLPRLGAKYGIADLRVKDESLNPTGSFKARGLAAAVTRARELGCRNLAIPSAGNAGAALAAYAARAGLSAHVFVPKDTPRIIAAQCQAYGAHVYLVDGLISDAGRIVAEEAPAHGWFDVSTLKEPYRAEGKKTMGFEVAEQLGWTLPDVIVYPTGGGTGIIGMWKAFAELEAVGLIGQKRPRMIVVQSSGCAPMVRAFRSGTAHAERWQNADTVALGLRVPAAIGDYLILDAVRSSGGTAIEVSDDVILATMRDVAATEGFFVSPESAAAFAGAKQLRASGGIASDEHVVVFSTGSGLLSTELIDVNAPLVRPDVPNDRALIA